MEKTSTLRTLKDHLYQRPTKLSEEMVRCMAAVYCWLRNSASSNIDQNRSPLLSRSSTNVVLPRRGVSEERDKSCKSVIEISSISTNKNHFSRASYAINNYRWVSNSLLRRQKFFDFLSPICRNLRCAISLFPRAFMLRILFVSKSRMQII